VNLQLQRRHGLTAAAEDGGERHVAVENSPQATTCDNRTDRNVEPSRFDETRVCAV
jgi:hypothetical protein